jgi:hypothetical protein
MSQIGDFMAMFPPGGSFLTAHLVLNFAMSVGR